MRAKHCIEFGCASRRGVDPRRCICPFEMETPKHRLKSPSKPPARAGKGRAKRFRDLNRRERPDD